MKKKNAEEEELKLYDKEKRDEQFMNNKERKKNDDDKLQRAKNAELQKSVKKAAAVSQRRLELLQERISKNAASSPRNLPGIKDSSSQMGDIHKQSAQNLAPMKQRAFSSTGRTQGQFNRLMEMEEVEAINNGLQRYEARMRKASELRTKQQYELSANMKDMTSKVDEKILKKGEEEEKYYVDMFERNVMKRKKMEEKKKKKAEENG